jgi:hypothetical protein
VTYTEGGRGSEVGYPCRSQWRENGENAAGMVPFIAVWAEGGWGGWDGSTAPDH